MKGPGPIGCAAVMAVAACMASEPLPHPVALSYPYGLDEGVIFDGYRDLAQAVAGAYVSVLIYEKTKAKGIPGRGIVNGASGTIIDPRGYLVTSAHIAKDARYSAEITTLDGRVHQGHVVHVDPKRELALLKIDPFPAMQVAIMADSRELRVAQRVFSIGTPYNKKGAVSLGRIVDPGRAERIEYAEYGYDDAIELHMQVEPGHSGGPVFDVDGRLIGILASFGLGNTRQVPYVSTRIAYAVPSAAISAYLAEMVPP